MSILTNRSHGSEGALARPAAALTDLSHGVLAFFRKILVARRQRLQLLALDDRMLADIGISRADAYREATRAYVDLPVTSRR